MKTKIALVVAIIMVITAALPGFVFAEGDTGLEDAIKSVKQLFDIPESFKDFSYSVNAHGDMKVWELNWRSKGDEGGSISAMVDNTGDVLNYYSYKYMDERSIKKLPKISKAEAQVKAEEIVKKASPGVFDSLKLVESNHQVSINDQTYHFSYVRTYNGIEFPLNRITVAINRQTGELQSYSKEWTKDISFPSADKVLSLKEAQEAYIKNFGIRLTYNAATEKDDIRVYAAYTPIYNSNYYIDAISGEKVYMGGVYYGGDYSRAEFDKQALSLKGTGDVVLTPEEIKAVEEVSKLITQENAEKIARELKVLELDDTFTLERASLYRNWISKTGFNWNLYFSRKPDDQGKNYASVSVSINASTGEITSFGTDYAVDEDSNAKFDKDAAKKEVEKFINSIQADKFKETEYDEVSAEPVKLPENQEPKFYSFKYVRKVNDVLFPDNGITVGINAVTGKIVNYNLDWYDVEFPSVENVIELEQIYETFFKEIGLKLQYNMQRSDMVYVKSPGQNVDAQKEVKLVYAVNTEKPARFDADTGAILDYDGKPYKEKKALEYTDISGHYAKKQIEILAETGIGLEGPELRPDEQIKQKDFLLLISQIINGGYEFYGKNSISSDEETENLYKMLIREGIVKEDEKNPEGPLTREDSVKFIIRALKYDKVAELSDIFNCTFKDKDEINPDLIGHVVIAKGLKIVNGYGEYFRPKAELKKADALIIIYNYLQI